MRTPSIASSSSASFASSSSRTSPGRPYERVAKRAASLVLFLCAWASSACGPSAPPPNALENRTFYHYDDLVAKGGGSIERLYPPLDKPAEPGLPAYLGVSLFDGAVHLSRPVDWKIRRIGITPERRFVEYVSPNAYLFAIYERTDSPADPWREVLGRYEEDAKASNAEIVAGRVPVATWNAQGREYLVRRKVKGQRGPYQSRSREVVLRSPRRVDLLEIVQTAGADQSTPEADKELLRVLETFELD
jgi:hypothetical protein